MDEASIEAMREGREREGRAETPPPGKPYPHRGASRVMSSPTADATAYAFFARFGIELTFPPYLMQIDTEDELDSAGEGTMKGEFVGGDT
uniref:Uncharacterized protein n=1 Tax=Oryza glumipatula TaxID=40148 RepID=A0A0D9ZYR8_9ORYZ